MAPQELLSEHPPNYRRWWNNEVEEGGQTHAREWTAADQARLHSLVEDAHKLQFWIRFYTLDGFAEGQGWSASYNFGTRDEVFKRWKAALNAGVDLIATD